MTETALWPCNVIGRTCNVIIFAIIYFVFAVNKRQSLWVIQIQNNNAFGLHLPLLFCIWRLARGTTCLFRILQCSWTYIVIFLQIDNIRACLACLGELGVSVDGVQAEDVRHGNLKAILGVFFSLSRHKQHQKHLIKQSEAMPRYGYITWSTRHVRAV